MSDLDLDAVKAFYTESEDVVDWKYDHEFEVLCFVPDLVREVERLTAKLAMPCGSCHPCTNWAPQTWINAGKRIPHVIDWEDLVEENKRLKAHQPDGGVAEG